MGARMMKIMSLFQNQLVFIVVAVIAVGAIIFYLGMQMLKKGAGNKEKIWPLGVNANFLTAAEQSFFGVLRQIVGDRFQICPKVNLGDVLFVKKGTDSSLRQTIFNKISRKHLDFVLLDPKTLVPVMAIELDDSSHKSASAIKRDSDKNKALNDAGLKLVRITAKRSYTFEDLKDIFATEQQNANVEIIDEVDSVDSNSNVDDIVNDDAGKNYDGDSEDLNTDPVDKGEQPGRDNEILAEIKSAEPLESTTAAIPLCPKCNVEMLKRQASRGNNAGQQFWGCPNFPKCREIIPI